MRAMLRRLAMGVIVLLALPAQAALQITDDKGVVVNFERPPQRIVSLLPSLAETVCELGHCQRLVGVDRYTNWPESLKPLPRVGGGLDPNIEQIVALRPDVVLMATSSRAGDRLRALGIKVLARLHCGRVRVGRSELREGKQVVACISDAFQVQRTVCRVVRHPTDSWTCANNCSRLR